MCQKIRSLANHCYDLRVRRPTKQQISSRLLSIAHKEGIAVEGQALELLCESVGGDIRQVLNALQMWRSSSDSMRISDVQQSLNRIEKDKVLRQSAYEACGLLLGGPKNDISERYNSFFIDYSLVPLLVQENYIDAAKNGIFRSPLLDDSNKLEKLAQAAHAVSDMELAGARIMGENQHWELLPVQAAMAVRAGSIVNGFQAFPSFPSWLGKNSTRTKRRRLTQDIVTHTSLTLRQGFSPIRLEYIPYLREILLQKVLYTSAEGLDEVIAIFDEVGISKEDFSDSMKELQFTVEPTNVSALTNRYDRMDAQMKAALTRAYNKLEHRSQALVSELQNVKKKRGGASGGNEEEEDMGTTEDLSAAKEEEEEEKDNDVGDVSAFVKKQKKRGAGGGAASSSGAAAAKKTKAVGTTGQKGKKK